MRNMQQPDSFALPNIHLQIFGATDEDVDRLRIVSLFDVDLEKAFGMQVSTHASAVLPTDATRLCVSYDRCRDCSH